MVTLDLGIEGYFVEIDDLNATLKKKYVGERNGKKAKCEKTIGYYSNVKDAIEKVLKILPNDINDGKTVTLTEYIDSLKQAERSLAQLLQKMGYR